MTRSWAAIALLMTALGCKGRAQSAPHDALPVTESKPAPAAAAPIMLGITAPYEGPLASAASEFHRGASTYFADLDDRGGVFGRPITLVARDDRGERGRAAANVVTLFEEDRVFCIFGGTGTDTLVAATAALGTRQADGAFGFGPMRSADVTRSPHALELWLNIEASLREEAQAIAGALAAAGVRSAVLLRTEDAAGGDAERVLREAAAQHGLEISRELDRVAERHEPFAVVVFAEPSAAAGFARDARKRSPDAPIAAFSIAGDAVLSVVPSSDAPVLAVMPVPHVDEAALPLVAEFRSAMERRHPHVPARLQAERPHVRPYGAPALQGYLTAKIFSEALHRSGPMPTRTSFRAALERMGDFDLGLGGARINFMPGRPQGLGRVWLVGAQRREPVWAPVGDPVRFLRATPRAPAAAGRRPEPSAGPLKTH